MNMVKMCQFSVDGLPRFSSAHAQGGEKMLAISKIDSTDCWFLYLQPCTIAIHPWKM